MSGFGPGIRMNTRSAYSESRGAMQFRILFSIPLALLTLAGCDNRQFPTGPAPKGPVLDQTPLATPGGSLVSWGYDSFSQVTNTPAGNNLSLIHISEPTRLLSTSYAVFCLKKK